VIQRTSEIGVRIALGAKRGEMVWIMLRRAVVWVAIGVVIGTPLAWSAAGVAQSLLFGLGATDVRTWFSAAVVLSAMGLLAGYIPARRATRVDPLVALRHD